MSQLIIDIGNTRVKYAIFDDYQLIEQDCSQDIDIELIYKWVKHYEINKVLVSDVRNIRTKVEPILLEKIDTVLFLDENTRLPIKNHYRTPSTLGKDRIAAVVGAWHQYPNKNCLVVDAGTAITYDFLDASGTYLGGNISPGLMTRFKSLHDYTGKLPLLKESEIKEEIGKDTTNAITSGVELGIIFEVERYISYFSKKYSDLHVIITGGDALFFERNLKNSIFVDLNVTLTGLNRILIYNDK